MTGDRRAASLFVLPALSAITLIAIVPMVWTAWESLHAHDLRLPWLGRPFVGLANYIEAFGDARFMEALAHTALFTLASVTFELLLGLVFALVMSGALRLRGAIRVVVLASWAVPTVVAALIWRFLFEGSAFNWFAEPLAAWVPIVLADAWKMTPFVALLLLAGLQSIDPVLYDAARMDGASVWQQFRHVTLPLLRPALLVALLFRTLDAFRVFDVVYVMTAGGPGTATEVVSLYTFSTLLQHLRFGYGSALSMIIFLATFFLALLYIRAAGSQLLEERR
jgi:ABC-type sugar transport system permease subunit